jgi:butyrate kinase
MLVEAILDRVSFIGPSLVYPGENELEALAAYLSEVLSGKRSVEQYSREV